VRRAFTPRLKPYNGKAAGITRTAKVIKDTRGKRNHGSESNEVITNDKGSKKSTKAKRNIKVTRT
jgi:hypothetical protein